MARQGELRGVKRVLEARTSVSVPSTPPPHKKEAKWRKGKKDEADGVLCSVRETKSRLARLYSFVRACHARRAEPGARGLNMTRC